MIEGQEGVSWDEWVALARACEENGLEGLFRSDHYQSVFDQTGRGSLDAWATISALAAVTDRIRLGTMVSPATFRRPSVLSRMVATADHVSGGRVELGLGGGWNVHEHEAHGFPFPDIAERMEILDGNGTCRSPVFVSAAAMLSAGITLGHSFFLPVRAAFTVPVRTGACARNLRT